MKIDIEIYKQYYYLINSTKKAFKVGDQRIFSSKRSTEVANTRESTDDFMFIFPVAGVIK